MKELPRRYNTQQVTPIIFGSYVNALGIARSLGEHGIHSICFDCQKKVAAYSKYVHFVQCPDPKSEPDDFLNSVKAFFRQYPIRAIAYTTNDEWLIPLSKSEAIFKDHMVYPFSDWKVIERAINKLFLYPLAESIGLPVPATRFYASILDLRDADIDSCRFPMIMKPAITVGFLERLRTAGRTIHISDRKDLLYVRNKIIENDLQQIPMVTQEIIPGPASNLYTISTYTDRKSRIVAYSTGHKIRQFPPDYGCILSGRLAHRPELYPMTQRLMSALGFHGIANTEFKLDERSGLFQLIEINPRPGMYNYSATASGINLSWIAYQDVVEDRPYTGPLTSNKPLVWIYLRNDLRYSMKGYRKSGYPAFQLKFREWRRSIAGPKCYAIESLRDPLPMLRASRKVLWDLLRYFLCGR